MFAWSASSSSAGVVSVAARSGTAMLSIWRSAEKYDKCSEEEASSA
jgi:hypothetical protein